MCYREKQETAGRRDRRCEAILWLLLLLLVLAGRLGWIAGPGTWGSRYLIDAIRE